MVSLWAGTNAASREDFAVKFDHMSLQNWGLSNRTLNALLSYNFKMTVGDVIRTNESFSSVKGLGRAGIEELTKKISQLLAETRNSKSQLSTDQSTILTNLEQSVGPLPKLLPQASQSLSLDQLHLDVRTHDALTKVGMTTIGELYNARSVLLSDIHGFHPGSLGNVNGSLITLLNSIDYDNNVNWFQYWKVQGIQILPSTFSSSTTSEQVISEIPKIIEEIIRREYNERSWMIIQRRFGLGKTEKLTLEDMANVFGLTRERIRQLEEKALQTLEKVLVEERYAGKNFHVHPLIHLMIQTIRNIIVTEPNKLILETKLLERIRQSFNVDSEKLKSSLFPLISLIGAQRIVVNYLNAVPIWGYIEIAQRRVLESGIKRLDDFLTRETIFPQTEIDILVRLNKGVKKSEKLTLAELPGLIELCSSIERREDGSVWGRFESLKGRGNQVERILVESGSPLRIVDIARTINHRSVPSGQRRITAPNLLNQIVGDDRFVPIGRSGQWGLKSWQHLDTKNVLALMEECLIARNKPATIDEIFAYVIERRPVKKHSITWYLTEKETFVKIGRTTWGLANWSDATETDAWNKEQVAEFVASIFKYNKAKELSYKMLKEALMKEANVSAKQAQGLLSTNPVLKTRRVSRWGGERIAIFQSNYKTILADGKKNSLRQKVSLRQQVQESAHSILEAAPNKQMPMAKLIRQLHKQFERPENTLYAYVKTMDSIERIDVPNSSTKICRLSEAMNSIDVGNIRNKVNKRVRALLEAAPNQQMLLDDLIQRLLIENRYSKKTLYQYIADLDYIERLDIPNSRAKLCRMKDIHSTDLFPQIQNIKDATLKVKVERVLPFFTEENVDIGLFLLSKEFEATLKNYILKAGAKGKLSVLPLGKTPDNWKLIGMVDFARDNGIISDHATFHYLRQARNDRAHGTMPSLAERQLLMKSIQYIAGLYIDYIKLLDDLTQNL